MHLTPTHVLGYSMYVVVARLPVSPAFVDTFWKLEDKIWQ
jgi:hypothetical protein